MIKKKWLFQAISAVCHYHNKMFASLVREKIIIENSSHPTIEEYFKLSFGSKANIKSLKLIKKIFYFDQNLSSGFV